MEHIMIDMTTLNDQLNQIAQEFTARIVATIRNASFSEVAGMNVTNTPIVPAPKKGPGRPKASASTGGGSITQAALTKFVEKNPQGVRAEAVREHFNLDKAVVAKVLKKALAEGLLRKEGQKRATTYFYASMASGGTDETLGEDPEPEHTVENPAAVLAAQPASIDVARELVKTKKKGKKEARVEVVQR
jgi:hypothetical protein